MNTKTCAQVAASPQPAVTLAVAVAGLVFGSIVMLLVTVGQLVA